MRYYKENFEEVIERRKKIQNPEYCGAVVQITGVSEMTDRGVKQIPCKPLNQWDFDNELYDFMDIKLQNSRINWSHRTDVPDDSIPALAPCFGIAEHSLFMGGKASFEVDTSYQIPFVETEEDIDALYFHRDNKLLNYVLKALTYVKEKGEGEIGVHLRGANDPGDVANAIRGNDFFMDFYDEPENLQKLLKKCCDANKKYMKLQRDIVGDFCGGTLTGMSGFLPANSFGHMAADWTYMCSADFFKEFDKDLIIEMLEPYTMGLMHVHSGGAHIIPEIASIDKIGTMQISHDPNQPTVLETFKKYESNLKNKLIIGSVSFDELKNNVEFLQDKRIQIQIGAKTFDEAKAIIHFVRENLPIRKRK